MGNRSKRKMNLVNYKESLINGIFDDKLRESVKESMKQLKFKTESEVKCSFNMCLSINGGGASPKSQNSPEFYKESLIDAIPDDQLKRIVKENKKYLKFIAESEVKCGLCGVKLSLTVNSWVCHFRSMCHSSKLRQSLSPENACSSAASATYFMDSLALRHPSLEPGQKKRINQLMNEAKDEINVLSLQQNTNKLSFYCNACRKTVAANKVAKHLNLPEHQSKLRKMFKRPQMKNAVPTPPNKIVVAPAQCNKTVTSKPVVEGVITPTDRISISTTNHAIFQSPEYEKLDSIGQETVKKLVAKLENEINELSIEYRGPSEEPYFFCNVCKASLRAVFVVHHVYSPYHLSAQRHRDCAENPVSSF